MPSSPKQRPSQPKPLDPDDLLTPDEAAAEARTSRQTIYNWINSKTHPLRASKPGREWRIRRGDLIARMRNLGSDVADGERSPHQGANVRTPPPPPPDETPGAATVVTGRFVTLKAVPTPAPTLDTSAAFERLLFMADLVLHLRRYSYAAIAAANNNDLEWAAELQRIITHDETHLMTLAGSFTAAQIAELRTIVRTTPIKAMFDKFELSLTAAPGPQMDIA